MTRNVRCDGARVALAALSLLLLPQISPAVAQAAAVCGTWNAAPTPNPSAEINRLTGVAAVSANDVWAVGFYDADPDLLFELDQTLIAHWNGSSWSLVPSPNVGPSGSVLEDVAAVASNDVWAVGYSSTFGDPQTLVLHWNGSSWSVVASPVVQGGSSFESISVLSATNIWAVGYRAGGMPNFTTDTGTMIAHWNGSGWTEVPSPNIGNRWNNLTGVKAISANDIWAVGSWRNISVPTTYFQTLTQHWNGSSWAIVASPNPSLENSLSVVAGIAGNDVWAVGGGWDGITSTPYFFHWNGSAWNQTSSPGGADGGIITLAPDDAWAVADNIAHWDGATWSLVPNPIVPGASWITLQAVTAVSACEAWAVGHQGTDIFTNTAQTLAVHLTAGVLGVEPVAAGSTRIVDVAPNPARGETGVVFELSRPGQAALRLFDLRGRLVATLAEGFMGAGRHVFSLGAGVTAMSRGGLYFLQLSGGGVTSSRKLVVLD